MSISLGNYDPPPVSCSSGGKKRMINKGPLSGVSQSLGQTPMLRHKTVSLLLLLVKVIALGIDAWTLTPQSKKKGVILACSGNQAGGVFDATDNLILIG